MNSCNYQFYLYKNYAYNKNWNLGYSKTFNKLLSFILFVITLLKKEHVGTLKLNNTQIMIP